MGVLPTELTPANCCMCHSMQEPKLWYIILRAQHWLPPLLITSFHICLLLLFFKLTLHLVHWALDFSFNLPGSAPFLCPRSSPSLFIQSFMECEQAFSCISTVYRQAYNREHNDPSPCPHGVCILIGTVKKRYQESEADRLYVHRDGCTGSYTDTEKD